MTDTIDRPQQKKGGDPVDSVRMLSMPVSRFEYRSEVREDGSIGTLFGYASVFDDWTEIESWEGHFLERIAPGAFADTLRDHGDRVRVLFNHGLDPQIGEKPLGRPRVMREDSRGLYVEVPLDDTSYNRDLLASLKSGAIDGMSFRFRVGHDRKVTPRAPTSHNPDALPERTILTVGRLYEFGPVTFQAYKHAAAGARASTIWPAFRNRREVREARRSAAIRAKAKVLAAQVDMALWEERERNRKYGPIKPKPSILDRVDAFLEGVDSEERQGRERERQHRERFLASRVGR